VSVVIVRSGSILQRLLELVARALLVAELVVRGAEQHAGIDLVLFTPERRLG